MIHQHPYMSLLLSIQPFDAILFSHLILSTLSLCLSISFSLSLFLLPSQSDVLHFREDFLRNGPMVDGIAPNDAVDRLSRFKEELKIRERKMDSYRGYVRSKTLSFTFHHLSDHLSAMIEIHLPPLSFFFFDFYVFPYFCISVPLEVRNCSLFRWRNIPNWCRLKRRSNWQISFSHFMLMYWEHYPIGRMFFGLMWQSRLVRFCLEAFIVIFLKYIFLPSFFR